MKEIALRIKKVRQVMKLSQEALAQKLGVTKQAISNIENSKSAPSIQLLYKLADYYNTSIDYIVGDTNTFKRYPEKK